MSSNGRVRIGVPSAVVGVVFVLTFLFLGTPLWGANTIYVSKSHGSNHNTLAQATVSCHGNVSCTPWASLPGMVSCSLNCASYRPGPGDHFILYGGDSWSASDLGVNWHWSGTSSSKIYIGVDKTWYSSGVCGSSWCRPIFNCGGAACAGNSNDYFQASGSYVTFDNIEMTGIYQNDKTYGTDDFFVVYAPNVEIKNMYFHGWSHGPVSTSANIYAIVYPGSCSLPGTLFHNNVVDGSDTTKDSMNGIYACFEQVYNNYFRYVVSAVLAHVNYVHDNVVEYPIYSYAGDHANGIFNFGPYSGTAIYQYNNVIRHTTRCAGCVNIWYNGYTGAHSSLVAYGFNNVMYDLNSSNIVDIASHPAGNYGNYYLFNNTTECGSDTSTTTCIGGADSGKTFQVYMENNHWITSGAVCSLGSGQGTCETEVTDLAETVATANSQGYTSSQRYAFSPTSATAPTVRAGTNMRSTYCTQLSAIDPAMGAACRADATDGCSYKTSHHTLICPARTANTRPSSTPWDIGAYEYATRSNVEAPTDRIATVK